MSQELHLYEWSLDLEERYDEYRLGEGELDRAREALRQTIEEPIRDGLSFEDQHDNLGITVSYKDVYIGDIWPPDDFDDDPHWGNYPAPIIRVDDETPITAGYSFDDGKDAAIEWFVARLAKIRAGEWGRGDGR